jgi:hypothetical protein
LNAPEKYRHWISDSTNALGLELIQALVIALRTTGDIDHVFQIQDVLLIPSGMVEMVQKMIRIFFRHLQQQLFDFFQGAVSHGVSPRLHGKVH